MYKRTEIKNTVATRKESAFADFLRGQKRSENSTREILRGQKQSENITQEILQRYLLSKCKKIN
jgi:hypothetical protein